MELFEIRVPSGAAPSGSAIAAHQTGPKYLSRLGRRVVGAHVTPGRTRRHLKNARVVRPQLKFVRDVLGDERW